MEVFNSLINWGGSGNSNPQIMLLVLLKTSTHSHNILKVILFLRHVTCQSVGEPWAGNCIWSQYGFVICWVLGAFTSLNHDIWGNEFGRLFTSFSLVSRILDHEVRWHSRCYFCESFHGRFLGKHFWTTCLPVEMDHDIAGLPHPLPPHFHFHFLSAGCTDNTGMEGTGRKGRDLESWRELYRKQTSRRASPGREGTWGGFNFGLDRLQTDMWDWVRKKADEKEKGQGFGPTSLKGTIGCKYTPLKNGALNGGKVAM